MAMEKSIKPESVAYQKVLLWIIMWSSIVKTSMSNPLMQKDNKKQES